MPSSPMKVSAKRASPPSTKPSKEADDLKSEETLDAPPPLEVELNSLTVAVDLTNDSDKENGQNQEDDDESAHSLSPPSKHKANHKQEANSDDDSDSDDSDDDDSSSDDDNPLFDGMDEETKKMLKAKMKGIQAGYDNVCEEERKRRIAEIKHQIHFNLDHEIDDDTASFIDEFVEEHKVNLQEKLQDEGIFFLESINEMIQQKKAMDHDTTNNSNNHEMEGDYEFPEDDDDEEWMIETKKRKRKYAEKRKNLPKNTNLDGSKRCGRLLLNDALKNIKDQTDWSDARKKAWKNRKTHQNAYFYRFNVPGQPQRNGKWTKAEHELFMKRALEMGVNDQWGIFSKVIPGRVGYQCSNYWRGLVKDGDVIDPNYRIDGNKLHFLRKIKNFKISDEHRRFAITIKKDISGVWKNLPMKHPKHPSDAYCREVQQVVAGMVIGGNKGGNNGKSKNKRKRKRNAMANDDSDEEWDGGQSKKRRRRNNKKDGDETFYCKTSTDVVIEDDNPIPDFVDIMTGLPVTKPAISPYGHVLGYDTWTKILRTSKQKNMCPFTLQKMTRRSLVKLTKSNIDEYRDKMVNLTKDQVELMNTINKDD